jgi:acyl phosphate:glycerol-3-phosphate acyltransferase
LLLSFACIVIAYFIGSISSSYVVGLLTGTVDIRNEPDGRVSAAAIYRKAGLPAFALVVIMDVGLAASAVMIAKTLTGSIVITMLASLAAVVGHNWSPFLRLKGGLGATTICGIMGTVAWEPFVYGLGVAGVLVVATLKPGLSTAMGILTMSGVLFIQGSVLVGFFPLALLALMILKRYQLNRGKTIPVPKITTPLDGHGSIHSESELRKINRP